MKFSFLLVAATLLCATLFSTVLSASCYTLFDEKDLFTRSLNLRKGKSGSAVQGYMLKNEYTDLDFSNDGSGKPIVRLQPQGGCTAAVVKAFTDVKDMRMYVTIHKTLEGKYVYAEKYGDSPMEIDEDVLAKIADSEVKSSLSITPEENVIYLANLQCGMTDKKIVKFTFPRVIYQNYVTLRWDILEDNKGPSDCSAQEDDAGQTSSASVILAEVQLMMIALVGSTTGLWIMSSLILVIVGCLSICSCVLCCMHSRNKRAAAAVPPQAAPSQGSVQFIPTQPQTYGSKETQPLYPPQQVRSHVAV